MRQAYQALPVYTGDISGVCSALFELGGMVVIHDPSGCNSTYNTHDEIRWYDQDSLIFISGLTERDAALGNDERLVRDVVEAADQTHPRFIVLVSSPIPFQIGTDLAAVARLVEARSGVPTRCVPTNGMHDYVRGAGLALQLVAGQVMAPLGADADVRPSVNVLGMTPLDFAAEGTRESLVGWLEGAGFRLQSCWAMGDTLDTILAAARADANLVVSATGMRAARVLERRLGIPYVVGFPVGTFAGRLERALRDALRDGRSRLAYQDVRRATVGERRVEDCVPLIGEPVSMGSIAASLELVRVPTRLVTPLEDTHDLLEPSLWDVCAPGEERLRQALAQATLMVGDPFLSTVCPQGARFCDLPHLALSGRQWLHEIPDVARLDPLELLGGSRLVGSATLVDLEMASRRGRSHGHERHALS